MPRTKREVVSRKNVRIPKPLVDEVDGIVERRGLYVNRQQFIESAIREKVERFLHSEGREAANPGSKSRSEAFSGAKGDCSFLVHIKETILAHTVINLARGEALPGDHLDLRQFEENIRRYVRKKAEQKGSEVTEERLNRLTEELLEYHREMLEGLNLIASP